MLILFLKSKLFLWLIIISGFVLTQQFTLLTGKEVLLKTVPVDPRYFLRGDYVILNYEIAQISNENIREYIFRVV